MPIIILICSSKCTVRSGIFSSSQDVLLPVPYLKRLAFRIPTRRRSTDVQRPPRMWSLARPPAPLLVIPRTLPLSKDPNWPPSAPSTSPRPPTSPRSVAARRSSQFNSARAQTAALGPGQAHEFERASASSAPGGAQRVASAALSNMLDNHLDACRTNYIEQLPLILRPKERLDFRSQQDREEAARSMWRRFRWRLDVQAGLSLAAADDGGASGGGTFITGSSAHAWRSMATGPAAEIAELKASLARRSRQIPKVSPRRLGELPVGSSTTLAGGFGAPPSTSAQAKLARRDSWKCAVKNVINRRTFTRPHVSASCQLVSWIAKDYH